MMVKLVFCLRRQPHLTREEFQHYWLTTHGPLVRARAEAMGVLRYVQSHTLDTAANDALRAGRGGPEAYDGVAELWWDSLDGLLEGSGAGDARQAAAELLADERTFLDLANSPIFLTEEHEIVG